MNRKKKTELMGKIVTVEKVFRRRNDPAENWRRYWEAVEVEPRAGWVVGFRHLQNGKVNWDRYDYGERVWRVVSTVPCIQVVYWHHQNPVHIPYDGYVEGGDPVPTATPSPMSKYDRAYLKHEMTVWPRDEKGRWIRYMDMTQEQRQTLRNKGNEFPSFREWKQEQEK